MNVLIKFTFQKEYQDLLEMIEKEQDMQLKHQIEENSLFQLL